MLTYHRQHLLPIAQDIRWEDTVSCSEENTVDGKHAKDKSNLQGRVKEYEDSYDEINTGYYYWDSEPWGAEATVPDSSNGGQSEIPNSYNVVEPENDESNGVEGSDPNCEMTVIPDSIHRGDNGDGDIAERQDISPRPQRVRRAPKILNYEQLGTTTEIPLLRNFVNKIKYIGPYNETILFNEKGEYPETLNIENWDYNPEVHGSHQWWTTVGTFDPHNVEDQQLLILPWRIAWKHGKVPCGVCSAACIPGTRRALRKGSHTCCYDCVPCSEGEISNVSDSENCQKCSDDEWPNEEKDECIPRILEFLSYKTDMIAIVFSSISVLYFILTIFIIGIFVSFRDTPIVKANNRNLSFILLISLKLSLLCVYLFIGRPVDITCLLRQISFGILFTIAVSSVLAKTVMVCFAFKATKPGSSWRKCLGVKLPNSIVFICSSVQVLNSGIWLSVSPPFQEYDRNTYTGMIIIQCNEGSALAFYFMLGYMGFLAALSFGLAFMVRTLPDIFNEAKYITFSMLVFCSVWVCAIPAYLSSKGKNMVTVEIFAILASCIGVMSCIFFPKCYNILLRPEMNSKKYLLGKG
ncbi:vomeronasal type-2 receptor 26-like [Pseudophryne corroboree]|uniref:vomeronasal type-2 receptor 26-like n=1 Tax=Pseudophryne corroboree TaxID=495146 RepID=UPI0030821C7A